MTRMAGGLLQQVHEHPSKADRPLAAGVPAGSGKARSRGDNGISAPPRLPVGGDRRWNRVLRADLVVVYDDLMTGEAMEDPKGFGPGHVPEEPEEAGPTGHR